MHELLVAPDLPYYIDDGSLRCDYHPGQQAIMDSTFQYTVGLGASQAGKTVISPHWLFREMVRQGAGDYMVVGPTYSLMGEKLIPDFKAYFGRYLGVGKWSGNPLALNIREDESRKIGLSPGTYRIIFKYANKPDQTVSSTIKASVLDEAGHGYFSFDTFNRVNTRMSTTGGRMLMISTPYADGWFRDCCEDGMDESNKDFTTIKFITLDNPAADREFILKQKAILPDWMYKRDYEAEFTRSFGLVFSALNSNHFINPDEVHRYKIGIGVDFGNTNMAASIVAFDQSRGKLYVIGEYYNDGVMRPRSTKDHVYHISKVLANSGAPRYHISYGGAPSEDKWRKRFKNAGLPIQKPRMWKFDEGITLIHDLIKDERLHFFNTCVDTRTQLLDYKYDDKGKIMNKSTYHVLDAMRYAITGLLTTGGLDSARQVYDTYFSGN